VKPMNFSIMPRQK